jgi:ATP-dependent helicase HrpB
LPGPRRGARRICPPQQAALAYPDRIGLRRPGDEPRWVLSGGRGAVLDPADPLAGARLIVATDLDGAGREARIRQAVEIGEAELRAYMPGRSAGRISASGRSASARCWPGGRNASARWCWTTGSGATRRPTRIARAMLEGVRDLGLPWSDAARRLSGARALLRAEGAEICPTCPMPR